MMKKTYSIEKTKMCEIILYRTELIQKLWSIFILSTRYPKGPNVHVTSSGNGWLRTCQSVLPIYHEPSIPGVTGVKRDGKLHNAKRQNINKIPHLELRSLGT